MTGLTQRQQVVLDFIRRFRRENGFSPSLREIAKRFGIQVNGAVCHLRALEKKGLLRCSEATARSIVLLDEIAPQPDLAKDVTQVS